VIEPPNLPQEERLDFFRGWIAGDGSVTTEKGKPKIELWSKSEKMIKWFEEVLANNEIESRIYEERNKKEFILRVSKKEDVKKFYSLIKIPHPRKQQRLIDLCSLSSRVRTV
jgi:intein-encoded DNA endonuclease-like protein